MANQDKNISSGLRAAEASSPSKSIDEIIAEAEKSIEETKDQFGDPSQQATEPTTEKAPEKPTTVKGVLSAAARGAFPTIAEAGTGAGGGAIVGGILTGGRPAGIIGGAKVGAQVVPLLSQLSDLTVNTVNAAFGTHYTGPKEATTHFLDKIGVPKPESSAEKIVEAVSEGASEMATGALGFKELGKALPAGKMQKAAQFLGEKPIEQGIAGGAAKGAGEYIKESGGGPWEQFAGELGVGVLTPAALKSLEIPARAGMKTFQALKDLDVSKIVKGVKTAFSPTEVPRVVEPEDINKTIVAASKGDAEAKRRLAAAAASMTPETKQAIEATGLELPAELTSASPEFKGAAQVAASAPGSEIAKQQTQSLDQLKAKADDVLKKAGAAEDFSGISDEIKNAMESSISGHAMTEKELYNKIGEAIDTKQFSAKSTLEAIQKEIEKLGGKGKDLSRMEKDILEKLTPQVTSKKSLILDELGNPISETFEEINPTYYKINELKKDIGEFIHNHSGPYKNERVGKAQYYYDKLLTDLDNAAKGSGLTVKMSDGSTRNVQDIVAEANNSTKARKDIEERTIELFGKKLSNSIVGKIKTAGKMAAEADEKKIENILNSVPEQFRQQVSASAIDNSIRDSKGNFSINEFTKWYGNLKDNPKSYNKLFENLPKGSKEDIENLYAISKNIDDSLKNRVQTGRLSQSALIDAYKNADTIASKIWHVAKHGAVAGLSGAVISAPLAAMGHHTMGIGAEIGSVLAGAVAGAKSISRKEALSSANELLTSPEFAKLVKASVGNPTEFSKAYTLLEKTPYWKRFVKETGLTAAQRASLFAQEAVEPQSQSDQIEAGLSAAESESK